MRRSAPGLAFIARRRTRSRAVVTDVVHATVRVMGQGATAPAVLGGTDEPFLDGHLARLATCQVWRIGDAFVVGGTVPRAWLRWQRGMIFLENFNADPEPDPGPTRCDSARAGHVATEHNLH